MPRVVLVPGTEYKRELPGIIKAKREYFGLSNEDVAEAVGVTERTMANRNKNPELFTLEQLQRLCKRLKFEIVINDTGIHCRLEGGGK